MIRVLLRIGLGVVTLLGILIVLLALPMGFAGADIFVILLGGWILFLFSHVSAARINFEELSVGIAALVLFFLGVHWLASWLCQANNSPLVREENFGETATLNTFQWPWRYSMALVSLVVLMFIAGVAMIGVVHQVMWIATADQPFVQPGSLEPARRNGSLSNLRQIAIASASFEATQGKYVSGCTTDTSGRLLHGWMVSLLPFLEERPLYERIQLDKPWGDVANAEAMRTHVPLFRNPYGDEIDDERGFGISHYAANVHVIGGDRPRNLRDIKDGLSQTIVFGEVTQNPKAWGSPTNWRDPMQGLGTSPQGFGGPWSGNVTLMVFGDCRARAISNDIDPQVLRALALPADGQQVNLDDL